MIKPVRLALMCGALTLLAGCGQGDLQSAQPQNMEPHSATFFAMDTVMELTVYGDEALLDEAEELVADMDSRLSVTDSGSEISALNRFGSGTVSEDTEMLLTRALDLCQSSGGALDVSIYPVVRAWGFTTGEYRVPEKEELSRLLGAVDYSAVAGKDGAVSLAPGMEIDLGSVAKGWAGDRILELFRQRGVSSALLNLGGNVQALGAKPDGSPWRVAVRDPSGEGCAGVVEVSDKAVVTSGGYQRYFEEEGRRYHHIIDPETGYPAESGLLSVTVAGSEGVECDGLSTALFVMGMDQAVEFWKTHGGFEAIFITEDGIVITSGLADFFEPLGKYQDMNVEVRYRDKNESMGDSVWDGAGAVRGLDHFGQP